MLAVYLMGKLFKIKLYNTFKLNLLCGCFMMAYILSSTAVCVWNVSWFITAVFHSTVKEYCVHNDMKQIK